MCREMEQIYLEGEKRGIEKVFQESFEKGFQEGFKKGFAETLISNIKNVMATLGMSIEEAMNALMIPENERGTYIDLLAKQ